jgi:PBP1b-binding outer membrane lipoprotein LpoB
MSRVVAVMVACVILTGCVDKPIPVEEQVRLAKVCTDAGMRPSMKYGVSVVQANVIGVNCFPQR